MPLTQLSLSASLTFALSRANNQFGSTTLPATTESFTLVSPSLTTWNQVFAQVYTLFTSPPAGLSASVVAGGTLGLNLLSAPAAPSVSNAATGGTITAGTYQVEVTYVNPAGETVASASSSTTTSGTTSTITINSPAASGNATGWYAYVTQAGGSTYTRQQAAGVPTAIGTNLTLTAPPTSNGANPPGSNTAAQPYYYKVTALGYNGFSASNETSGSNEVNVTLSSGNQTASLSWTALSGAVSYNVYRGTAAGAENLLVANVTTASYSDNGSATTTSQSPPGSMPATFVEFDISTFTTLANESATPGHVLGLIVLPAGTLGASQCTLAPGSTNGLVWFFGGSGQSIAVPMNGVQLLCNASNATGQVIDATHKTIRVTNGGTAATTVQVGLIVGP